MGDSLFRIGADQSLIQELLLFMVHIRNQQTEENVELLNLSCQDGVFIDHTIYDGVGCLIHPAYGHDVDALLGSGTDTDELTTHILAGAQKLMSFQRSNNEHLSAFSPHS